MDQTGRPIRNKPSPMAISKHYEEVLLKLENLLCCNPNEMKNDANTMKVARF